MFLHYHCDPRGNFGDDLNAWLWNRLLPDGWNAADGIVLVGIGTIIGRSIPKAKQYVVFSSGAGYQAPPHDFGNSKWHIICVRGPLTAEVLGLAPNKGATDGAALLSLLPEYTPLSEGQRSGAIFMPHHFAVETGNWHEVCARAGIDFIDPADESKQIICRIRSAKLVLADAMHAAVVADTLRVPWVPLVTSPEINTFKWLDWTRSLAVPYEPVVLPVSTQMDIVRRRMLPLRGRKFNVEQQSKEAAIIAYHKRRTTDASLFCRVLFEINRCIFDRAIQPLLMGGFRLTRTSDEFRLTAAAKVMQLAAQRTSYLSDERIFQQRVDQLSDGLERVIGCVS